jgi:hypothetical protein
MEPQKFVVRLLDHAGELLAWSTVFATPSPQERGASCPFWPVGGRVTPLTIERNGTTKEITVHWCELDVARRADIEPIQAEVGQVFNFHWLQPVWLVGGTRDVPLPAVTVRQSVSVEVKPGSLVGVSK